MTTCIDCGLVMQQGEKCNVCNLKSETDTVYVYRHKYRRIIIYSRLKPEIMTERFTEMNTDEFIEEVRKQRGL